MSLKIDVPAVVQFKPQPADSALTFKASGPPDSNAANDIIKFKNHLENVPVDKIVAIYGSSSTGLNASGKTQYAIDKKREDYLKAEELGAALGRAGFGVLTGGSVGTMEAANKGCYQNNGPSLGVTLNLLSKEQKPNNYCHNIYPTDHFYPRLEKYREMSSYQVAAPGGPGTLMEMFDQLCMMLTNRTDHKHQGQLVLMDKQYWGGLVEWLKGEPLKREYITQDQIDAIKLVDTPTEVVAEMKKGIDYDPAKIHARNDQKYAGQYFRMQG